jgi:DNA-binding transcriptional LysR family regulator
MELRHLRYFVAVAEELHFRRAADRLHVAQPAVSEQVRKLEAELGVRLLERTHRSVMLREARRIIRQADLARDAARNAGQHHLGRLRFGYAPDALPRYVPRSLARFAAAAPGIEVVLETGGPLALADAVREGELDVAVVSLPVPAAGLRVTPLGEEAAVCAVPSAHPLAGAPAIAPEQMASTDLLLLPRASNPALHHAVLGAWSAAGLRIEPRESEPGVDHLLLAVAAGRGIAVLPVSAAERYSVPGVSFVPLDAPVRFRIAVLSAEETTTTIAAFLRLIRTTAKAAVTPPRPPAEDRVDTPSDSTLAAVVPIVRA